MITKEGGSWKRKQEGDAQELVAKGGGGYRAHKQLR